MVTQSSGRKLRLRPGAQWTNERHVRNCIWIIAYRVGRRGVKPPEHSGWGVCRGRREADDGCATPGRL